jgi:RNA polymerase sigma-70 factor, ECF subfamily
VTGDSTGDATDAARVCRWASSTNGRNVEPPPRIALGERTMTERELLHAACDGDADAFRRLVEPHHAMLHARCYRMLGSRHDGEDALQDALLRAWRGLCGFNGRSGFRWWLYQITTNACLDAIARRTRRVRILDHLDPAESGERLAYAHWLEPHPDGLSVLEDASATPEARYEEREAVELAFAAVLEHLPPKQRAALVLRDVLSFSAKEAAESLGTTVPSVNSALQRARKSVEVRLLENGAHAKLRSLGDERAREIAHRFVEALERGDVRAIVAQLAEDATFARLPYAARHRGRDAITLRRAKIADVSALRAPEVLKRFRLPSELAA